MESGLEFEAETEGLITEISKDRCVVSIDINGTANALTFGKRFLYTFGQQCDGDMTNILEEEMEVNVWYRYCQTQDKLFVIAVWVGEKPDLSRNGVEYLDDIYNEKGIVDSIHDDGSIIVRADGMAFSAFVCLDVMYKDGCLLETYQCPFAIGDTVTFDATPKVGEHPGATYRATCAWIGTEPRLVDRFKLKVSNSSAQDLETLTKDCVYGIVVVIPNDAVAFVQVEDCGEKVLLFRSSFNQSSERIDDVVKVGDFVCMRLSFACIFSGCRQWFAVAACMNGEDISEVNREAIIQMGEAVSSGAQTGDECSPAMSEDDPDSIESTSETDDWNESSEGVLCEEFANAKAGESNSLPLHVGASAAAAAAYKESTALLYNEPPLKGIMCAKTKFSGIIGYREFNILVTKKVFFYMGRICSKGEFKSMRKKIKQVKFEAYPLSQFTMNTYMTHVALFAWIGDKPTLTTVALTLYKGNYFFPKDNIFEGTVIGFYLPKVAFLATGKRHKSLIFCLHLENLGKESQPKVSCEKSRNNLISDFLKIGEYVKFRVRQDKSFPFGMSAYGIEKSTQQAFDNFVRTLKPNASMRNMLKESETATVDMDGTCSPSDGMLESTGTKNIDEDSQNESWDSVWGSGEYFKTGEVENVGGNYVVKFVSSKVPDKEVRLDLHTAVHRKQFYCDGKQFVVNLKIKSGKGSRKPKSDATESMLEGREISIHVGRKISSAVTANDAGVIKCAWVGDYPELPTLLGGKTLSYGSLFYKRWCYEGVIEEFPIPTHAICKVGSLYVHLPLTPIVKNSGEMVGVVQSHLKKGDTVLLKIKTEYFPPAKIACLTSSFYTSVKKLYDDKDVFRVVQGTIIKLPNPVGVIKMLDGSITAKFDLSSVLAVNGVQRNAKIIYSWHKIMTKSIDVGVVVYFSAAKDFTQNSYRAYEVWIGESPGKEP